MLNVEEEDGWESSEEEEEEKEEDEKEKEDPAEEEKEREVRVPEIVQVVRLRMSP